MSSGPFFEVLTTDPHSRARRGRMETPHGAVETPSYVIVGTHAEVRTLRPEDLSRAKIQMIIANTYHLWRDLGDDGLHSYPGIHEAMRWKGPVMTDSGGFQVFSYGFLREFGMRMGKKKEDIEKGPVAENLVRITDAGVHFKPDGEGSEEAYLDAELSMLIQEELGADIVVAFDEPTSPAADYDYTKSAMERTHAWAERSLEAHASEQKIYGVVQGGNFEDLRAASAKHIAGLGFDGFAIGSTYGEGYGGTRADTKRMLEWTIPHLPDGKPRHLFGVGRIEDLFEGVEAGIDTFDCVIPTREARHGRLWTSEGHFDITKGKYADDDSAIDALCGCPTCIEEGATRASLHRMFKDKHPDAARFATIHNVFFFNNLMSEIRDSISEGRFGAFKENYLKNLAAEKAEGK